MKQTALQESCKGNEYTFILERKIVSESNFSLFIKAPDRKKVKSKYI